MSRSSTVNLLTSILIIFTATGCIPNRPGPAVTPATIVSSDEALPDFWWNKPAVDTIASNDFEKLWSACRGEIYVRLFTVDREQYREGLMTSEPLVSKQIFEPWRNDAVTFKEQAESSLGTIRRTIHFEVIRRPDGTYEAAPKVLVERFASAEHRLTSIGQYHQAFTGQRTAGDTPDQTDLPTETDYWYALRRDTNLEKDMAASIKHRLGQ